MKRPVLPQNATHLDARSSWAALGADWALIILGFAAAACWPHPATYAASAVLIARTQLALAVLMHEAAHGLLFRSRKMNNVVGQWFAAAPVWMSLHVYRHGHLKHHRAPMVADDPVSVIFEINDYPIPTHRLAGRLLRDFLGLSYFVSVAKAVAGSNRALLLTPESGSNRWQTPVSIVLVQGTIFGALLCLGHGWFFLGLWILPALTLLHVMGRVRAIMEHAGYGPGPDQVTNARTIVKPSWQTFLFGPHAIHYHIEHHVYPTVPFHRLGAVHGWMKESGMLPAANLCRGYGQVLHEVTRVGSAIKTTQPGTPPREGNGG